MSDFGITTWAQQPYSHDFAVGSNRPRKVRRHGAAQTQPLCQQLVD